jgi:type IV secretory pathway component VirB8
MAKLAEKLDKVAEGRDERTPVYLQLGVFGIVALVAIVALAIAVPLYYALGG